MTDKARDYKIRLRPRTIELLRECCAYAEYLDLQRSDAFLHKSLTTQRAKFRERCAARGIPPDFPLSGLKRAPKPMPDLRKPGPVVD